ncbi:hypothetical protein [Halomonas organivorans]|uniref:Uncharacterized protein n=1 Tax=Halomonas organivorans TaxID=257772 RepID=A0A7W5BYE9_9GAMM|nr:hypothetical protein [Halomonas organivorans]MBB3140503.1 hypothetical protein [Halomonas organivorans]
MDIMSDKILELSKKELQGALSVLPKDDLNKFVLFTEIMRILDYWSVFKDILPSENSLSAPDFEIIQLGWNLALEHLFVPVKPDGFPIQESTEKTRLFATSLLHKFGRAVLLKRTYEMLVSGFLSAETKDSKIIIRATERAESQFADNIEFTLLSGIQSYINENIGDYRNGWFLGKFDDPSIEVTLPGAYHLQDSRKELKKHYIDNVDELMEELVFPWDSGNGIMMGYNAIPEIDNHFFSLAIENAIAWRNDVGLHPSVKLNDVTGSELTLIVAVISALHMKHVRFALTALKKHKEISIPQSLTIWTKASELIDSIHDYTDFDKNLIERGVNAIAIAPSESRNLKGQTTPLIPLLVDLGNGILLRPVSSLIKNPFISTSTLQGWRIPNITDILSLPREDWMRNDLYHLFRGTRYKSVDGNIKIRNGGKVVTDIDAAILDRTTGDLALFQIKWQDYYTNDVRKLRSRAKNFVKEIDGWASKVSSWIEDNGVYELVKTLRLKVPRDKQVSRVYLFGLSKTSARMKGYGYSMESDDIAICNWPMFLRKRFEVGSSKNVFKDLHASIKKDENIAVKSKPVPVEINSEGNAIEFINLWNSYLDK